MVLVTYGPALPPPPPSPLPSPACLSACQRTSTHALYTIRQSRPTGPAIDNPLSAKAIMALAVAL